MSHWNYRVVWHKDGYLAVHEVFYNKGKPDGMSKEPTAFTADLDQDAPDVVEAARLELVEALSRALASAIGTDVFYPPDHWES